MLGSSNPSPAMKPLAAALLLIAAWTCAAAFTAATAQPAPDTEVRAIIDKALARMAWSAEQGHDARYKHSRTRRRRQFDGDGKVTEDETRRYTVEPYRGVPYARLIALNGEPIAGDDLAAEEQRWREFVEAVDHPPDEDEDDDGDDNALVFNAELISRYTARLDGIRELRGRPSYILAFEPKPGKLPVRRRIDHALNNSRGEIWVDQRTYEVARVDFELLDTVRLWWGILGSVSEATGHIERRPITEAAWLPAELDIYFQMRVLLSTTRRAETTEWSGFEAIAD